MAVETDGRTRFGLLGSLEVIDDSGAPLDIGGRQPRLVLALLLLGEGRPVPLDTLIDAIWADDPPASATGTLQSYVSRLRRRLDEAGGAAKLIFDDTGYRLEVDADAVDFRRFERRADEGRGLLDGGRPAEAREVLAEADALWRGPALAELLDIDAARGAARRLEERRLAAAEDRFAAELAVGRHGAIVAELTEVAAANPLREGLQQQLALALYRSGRQADALRVLADAARTLREELGIEPSRPLRELETAILSHDPALDVPASAAVATPPPRPSRAERDGATDAPARPALVGREPELAQLTAALDESAQDARFVVIEGEPGIGKTRLADELRFIAASRGAIAVWGRSDEGGAAPALWPWLPPLRALAAQAPACPPALQELVAGEAPLLAGQGAAMQFERFEAVADLLEQMGASRPVVVLLDDLQWADATSLELLAFLSARLRTGVVVVATMRQLEVGRTDAVTDALGAVARRAGSRRITLRGLTADATAEMLRFAADRAVPDTVSAAIHERAEGNPFYAIELSRLVDEEGGFDTEVPSSVGDCIRRRLARLPQPTVDLLGMAAITGRDVDLQLLARGAELELGECLDTIEPAAVHRLLVDALERPGVLRFSHALVREVLLDGLTSLRRARLHLKVADAIEEAGAGHDEAEILAEHLWQAAPVGVGHRAAAALERAADVAVSRVSYAAAEDLLTKALQLRRATGNSPSDSRAELDTLVRLLEVAQATRYFQGVDRDTVGRARALAAEFGLDDLYRRLFWFEWAALATSTRIDEAAPLAVDYLEQTRNDPRAEVRSGGHEVYGTACWGQGRITEAAEHFDLAVELLQDAPPPNDAFAAEQQLVSYTFSFLNHALIGDWSEEETFARFDALLEGAPAVAVAPICGFAGTTASYLARWDQVARYMQRALANDPWSQFAFWGGQLLMLTGLTATHGGDPDAGLAKFQEGRRRYVEIGARSGLATFEASEALLLVDHGRLDDARQLAQDARDELATYRERWNEPLVLLAEGVVAHAGGDMQRAADRLLEARRVTARQGSHAIGRRIDATASTLGIDLESDAPE